MPVAVRSKAYVCRRLLASTTGSNPADNIDVPSVVLVVFCVGNGLCDELITNSEESYRVCVCV
jgi:hypothetical protein